MVIKITRYKIVSTRRTTSHELYFFKEFMITSTATFINTFSRNGARNRLLKYIKLLINNEPV